MSNIREEILRLSVERLQNKVEGIMLSINILLSKPENADDAVEKISCLTADLAIANMTLNQATYLYNQATPGSSSVMDAVVTPVLPEPQS